MRPAKPRQLALAIAIVAAGCVGTPPPRYFTLDNTASPIERPRFNLEVQRLRPLDALARSEILIRKNATEIDYYALDHWATNLGELVSRKLNIEFGQPDPTRPTLIVDGDILAFERTGSFDAPKARAALDLAFRPKGASRYNDPILRRSFEAEVPSADATAASLTAALSRALESIAADIVGATNGLEAKAPSPRGEPRFHTLDMRSSGKIQAAVNIEILPLRRTDSLARNAILIRGDGRDIQYYPQDRWIAGVHHLVAEKLRAEFGPFVPGRNTVAVSGAILAFERVDQGTESKANVKLDLAMTRPDQAGATPFLWKIYEVETPMRATDARALSLALSEGLVEAAQQIAADASRVPPPPAEPDRAKPRLHTLDPSPNSTLKPRYNLVVTRLRLNDTLTRADILVRNSPTSIDYYPEDRWASSLAEMIADKLNAEFGPPRNGIPTLNISGAILAFEALEASEPASARVALQLELRWADAARDAPPAKRHIYVRQYPVGSSGVPALVAALSKAVEEIAADLVNDTDQLEPPAPESVQR